MLRLPSSKSPPTLARSAKMHVSIMGEDREEQLALAGLQHSAGFLQHKIADRIDTRYTPRLQFVLDKGVKNALAIASILNRSCRLKRSSPWLRKPTPPRLAMLVCVHRFGSSRPIAGGFWLDAFRRAFQR